jgi:predicted amidohydrolase YtcJ
LNASSRGIVIGGDGTLAATQAIQICTEFDAIVNKVEKHRGKPLPGLAADIAVWSRDLLTAAPEQILHDIVCDLTLFAGEPVHDREAMWR